VVLSLIYGRLLEAMTPLAGLVTIGASILLGRLSTTIDPNDGMTDREFTKRCFRLRWDEIHKEVAARERGMEYESPPDVEKALMKCRHHEMLMDLIRSERQDLNEL
jgi:hypothetical protein